MEYLFIHVDIYIFQHNNVLFLNWNFVCLFVLLPTMGQALLLGERAVPEITPALGPHGVSHPAMGSHIQYIQFPITILL